MSVYYLLTFTIAVVMVLVQHRLYIECHHYCPSKMRLIALSHIGICGVLYLLYFIFDVHYITSIMMIGGLVSMVVSMIWVFMTGTAERYFTVSFLSISLYLIAIYYL